MIIRSYTKNRLLYHLLSRIHLQFSFQLKLCTISILTLLLLTVNSYSQSSFGVSGTVTDNDGAPLSGVSVSLKNASIGTSTDLSGRFNLTVPNANGLLVFTYVGYTMQEIAIKNRTNISVQLVTAAKSLDDVVIVGYSTQRKSDLSGSVVSLRKEDFNKGVTTSLRLRSSKLITENCGSTGYLLLYSSQVLYTIFDRSSNLKSYTNMVKPF